MLNSENILIKDQVSCEGLTDFAEKIGTAIQQSASEPKVVWLRGDLGAGKTTFTKSLLRSFGLAEHVVVQSPTFTYINEYCIGQKYFAHCDFYRCDHFALAEELLEYRDFYCILVEWPEKVSDAPDPDFILDIAKLPDQNSRLYTLGTPDWDSAKTAH